MSWSRLRGSPLSRNSSTRRGGGRVPVRSRQTRLRNSWSLERSEGRMLRRRSFRQTSSSMKFRGGLPGKFRQDPAHHAQGHPGRLARRLDQDGGLARLTGPDQAVGVNLDHLFGGRSVMHPAGKILPAAVGEPGGDDQLLASVPLQHDLPGHDLQAFDHGAAISVGALPGRSIEAGPDIRVRPGPAAGRLRGASAGSASRGAGSCRAPPDESGEFPDRPTRGCKSGRSRPVRSSGGPPGDCRPGWTA